ncbi:MAG: hypothetical protein M3008_09050, partial [Chloroflexota bacterium]|nr:hypothetical protein [Chloroflexota bacterium]
MIGPSMYRWLRGSRGVAGLVVLAVLLPLAFSPVGTVHAASLNVTNCLDDGSAGSLRDVITNAAAGATITFATDCSTSNPITLTGGTLTLSKDVTIDGTGRQVVIDGNCATDAYSRCSGSAPGGSTVFTIPGGSVTLRALTIQHGFDAYGGAIFNSSGT